MSWRDRFQEGSFRGAPFLISESEAQFGRRQETHQYPGRDQPWAEDLGRAARTWNVACFVVGDDYDTQRDALIAAFEASGSGTLVHPYLGTMQASLAEPASVSESAANGGMATFSLQFVEAGADTAPSATADTQGQAVTAAGNAATAASAAAVAGLNVSSQAGFVIGAAQSVLSAAGSAIGVALGAVQPGALLAFSVQQQIDTLVTGGLTLLNSPALLASTIFTAVAGVGNLATYTDDALTQLTGPVGATGTAGLLGFGADLPVVAPTTPSRAAQAANQAILTQLVQVAAAAAAVTVISQMDFTSYDDAVAIRDPLADQLDTLATAIADTGTADDLADAVDDLRLALIRDVTARGASLARLYAYTPVQTEPALIIAQRLYGDPTRTEELVARNSIAAPLFTPGGVALEVLSDA